MLVLVQHKKIDYYLALDKKPVSNDLKLLGGLVPLELVLDPIGAFLWSTEILCCVRSTILSEVFENVPFIFDMELVLGNPSLFVT